jgi:hypothetical protein
LGNNGELVYILNVHEIGMLDATQLLLEWDLQEAIDATKEWLR